MKGSNLASEHSRWAGVRGDEALPGSHMKPVGLAHTEQRRVAWGEPRLRGSGEVGFHPLLSVNAQGPSLKRAREEAGPRGECSSGPGRRERSRKREGADSS